MSSVQSTLLTVGGTPTVFLPLPTPYLSHSNCAANIYSAAPDTFLAWDPVFAQIIATSASICIPSQISSWWLQAVTNPIYTALGPTFACPEAYSTITTSRLQPSWQEVYCCPSYEVLEYPVVEETSSSNLTRSFSVLALQPNTPDHYPSQCISLLTKGDVLTYMTTTQGSDGADHILTTSSTISSAATVFGGPVNGFNLVTSTSASSISPTGAPASSETTPQGSASTAAPQSTTSSSSSSSTSRGRTVGISVGVVLGVAVICIGAFVWWWRRRKRGQLAMPGSLYMAAQELPPNTYEDVPVRPPSPTPKELGTDRRIHELPGAQYR